MLPTGMNAAFAAGGLTRSGWQNTQVARASAFTPTLRAPTTAAKVARAQAAPAITMMAKKSVSTMGDADLKGKKVRRCMQPLLPSLAPCVGLTPNACHRVLFSDVLDTPLRLLS